MASNQTLRPLSCDALPLVLRAAFEHPLPSVKEAVHAWLLGWVDELRPRFTPQAIQAALMETRGTEVEPFTLTARDLEIATMATRAAFSARVAHGRFRIVSSDTLGIHGGLVLTSRLRSYYVERAAWGRHRNTPWRVSFVAPGWLSRTPPRRPRDTACSTITKNGWELRIPLRCWGDQIDAQEVARWMDVRRVQSSIDVRRVQTADDKSLTDRGLAISSHEDQIRLATTGAESLMRITAMSEQRQVLALQSRVKSAVTRVLVQLEPLETEATHCPVLFTETSRSTRQWAGFWSNVPLPLPLAYRAAIARAFPMHDSWVTPELIGKLL